METFSALLAICAGNSPVLPAQRPVTQSFDVFFDLRLNKRLNKQSWVWWCETLSRPLWRHRSVFLKFCRGHVLLPHVTLGEYMYVCEQHHHYNDVTMGTMASQITSLTNVDSTVCSDQIKENIKAPRHWPLCGGFTGEFPAQRASNTENVSIWWRHHDIRGCWCGRAWCGVCRDVSLI